MKDTRPAYEGRDFWADLGQLLRHKMRISQREKEHMQRTRKKLSRQFSTFSIHATNETMSGLSEKFAKNGA